MATPVQNAPKLEIGKLTAEDAERFASMFRPAWELDDAPFAAGTKLSANDMDALAAGAGIAPEVKGSVAAQAKAEVELDVEPDATPAAAPAVAQAKPEPPPAPARAKAPYTPPRAPPAPIRMAGDSGEYAPVKKSNTGVILAVVGVLAIGGAIFGIRAAMSNTKTEAPVVPTTTATHEEAHIPPPPPETANTASNDTKPAPTQEAPAPAVAQTSKPVETSKPAETLNPFAEAHAAPPAHTAATHPAPPPPHHAAAGGGAGSKPHGSGIVRDNPF